MSNKTPAISGKNLISLLEKLGFIVVRSKGSHFRLKHKDGRITTIPVHGNESIPKGLFNKILKDIEMDINQLNKLID